MIPLAPFNPKEHPSFNPEKKGLLMLRSLFSNSCCILSPIWLTLKTLWRLQWNTFPQIGILFQRSTKVYQVLQEYPHPEKPARIENIQSKKDPSVILYHKFIISRFINCKEWGQNPSMLRTIEGTTILYSYYDYMDAFEKVYFTRTRIIIILDS